MTVRYIGITRLRNLRSRLCRHLCDARNKKEERNHRLCWLRSLVAKNQKPSIFLVEDTDDPMRECFWIKHYRSQGADLVNSSDGCESHIGYVPPQSVRDAVRRAKRGRKLSFEHREALRQSLIGRPVSPETRRAIGKANSYKRSEETRERMAAAKRGHTNWSKGIPKPKEQRDKIAASLTGRRLPESTRNKISSALKGRSSSLKGKSWSAARRAAQNV